MVAAFTDAFSSASDFNTSLETMKDVGSAISIVVFEIGQALQVVANMARLAGSMIGGFTVGVSGLMQMVKGDFSGGMSTLKTAFVGADQASAALSRNITNMASPTKALTEAKKNMTSALGDAKNKSNDLGNAFNDLANNQKGAGGAGTKMADDISNALDKVRSKIQSVNDDIRSINERTEQLNVDHAKDTLDYKTKIIDEYIKQEQKIADLQKQYDADAKAAMQETDIRRASENSKKLMEQQLSLNKEREALAAKRHLEEIYQTQMEAARQFARKTEFEQNMEKLQIEFNQRNIEFTDKKDKLKLELEAKKSQNDALLKLEKQLMDQSIGFNKTKNDTITQQVDRLIEKYNQLASASARAYTSGSGGISYTPLNFTPAKRDVGGIVAGPYLGAPVPLIAHAGETITPASSGRPGNAMGGTNIIINNPMFLDRLAADKFAAMLMTKLKLGSRV